MMADRTVQTMAGYLAVTKVAQMEPMKVDRLEYQMADWMAVLMETNLAARLVVWMVNWKAGLRVGNLAQ